MNYPFSIIGLSETKIKTGMDPFINTDLPGYTFISQPTMSNGGVGFYIRNEFSFVKRSEFSQTESEFESLFVEFDIPHQHNIICGVIYRHPNVKLEKMLDFLYTTTEKINREGKYCLLMGDFNINLLNYGSHLETDDFVNTLGSYNFNPQILKPTRITHHSATLIDNIFFNSLEHLTISGNIISSITDHLPNFLIVNKLSNLPKNTKLLKRDYTKLDEMTLASEFENTNWTKVLFDNSNVTNVSTVVFQNFFDYVSKIINKHAPIRKYTRNEIKSLSKPWVTPGIKKSIKIKERL